MVSRVYMPQRPVVRVREGWADKYDLSPAERFGVLTPVMPVGQGIGNPREVMEHMSHVLGAYSDRDYLLAVGDPFLIAMAVLVAGRANEGRVALLKWYRDEGVYRPHLVAG